MEHRILWLPDLLLNVKVKATGQLMINIKRWIKRMQHIKIFLFIKLIVITNLSSNHHEVMGEKQREQIPDTINDHSVGRLPRL